MKKSILVTVLAAALGVSAQAQWHPAGDKIKTSWAEQVNPENVLPEYPRPVMERGEWKNLNGLWNYAITERGAAPSAYEGQILVPFAVESSLSGVGKTCGPNKELWYLLRPCCLARQAGDAELRCSGLESGCMGERR